MPRHEVLILGWVLWYGKPLLCYRRQRFATETQRVSAYSRRKR